MGKDAVSSTQFLYIFRNQKEKQAYATPKEESQPHPYGLIAQGIAQNDSNTPLHFMAHHVTVVVGVRSVVVRDAYFC